MYLKPLHLPKASILVLEEDPYLRAGLCSLLSAAGYLPAEAAGGANPAGRVDLVLRGLGPDQTPRAARELLDHSVPVILLVDHTAWTGLDFFDVANALGAAAVLQRPFSRSALLSLIVEVLSQPLRDAAEADSAALPGAADLLICLENPNFV
jgi:DNA-binding response OmpR family regulator